MSMFCCTHGPVQTNKAVGLLLQGWHDWKKSSKKCLARWLCKCISEASRQVERDPPSCTLTVLRCQRPCSVWCVSRTYALVKDGRYHGHSWGCSFRTCQAPFQDGNTGLVKVIKNCIVVSWHYTLNLLGIESDHLWSSLHVKTCKDENRQRKTCLDRSWPTSQDHRDLLSC